MEKGQVEDLFVSLQPKMGKNETYTIDLKRIVSEAAEFGYRLDDAFFASVGAGEICGGRVDAKVRVEPCAGRHVLSFSLQGVVRLTCDRCLDEMDCPVDVCRELVTKFGPEFSDEGDDLVVVSESEGKLDVAWYLYEFIALALPMQHVHEEGECNEDMVRALRMHSVGGLDDMDDAPEEI